MITIEKKFYKNFRSCPMGQFAAIHIYIHEEELVDPSTEIILQVRCHLVFKNKNDIPKDLRVETVPKGVIIPSYIQDQRPSWAYPKAVRDKKQQPTDIKISSFWCRFRPSTNEFLYNRKPWVFTGSKELGEKIKATFSDFLRRQLG
jgi:hypothetical protein